MNQPDQDRLLDEICGHYEFIDGTSKWIVDKDLKRRVKALIAREVRLGRYDELTKVKVYDDPADTIAYIRNRERELEKEPPMSEPTPREELTPQQHIKFNILVPLVSDVIMKRDGERGSLTKADESGRYNEAVDAILAWRNTEVLAVLDELEDEVNEFGFMRFDGAITQLKQRYGGKEQE